LATLHLASALCKLVVEDKR